jgi:hypothetical protein
MLLKERRFLRLVINPTTNLLKLIIGFIVLVVVISIKITLKNFR